MHQKIDQKRKTEGECYGEQIAWNLDDPAKHIRLDLHCRNDITVQGRTEHYTQNAAKNVFFLAERNANTRTAATAITS